MKLALLLGISVLSAGLGCALAVAQAYAKPLFQDGSQGGASGGTRSVDAGVDPVPLEWTPPALTELSLQATVKNSFTLDRTMLGVAAGMVPERDEPTRQAINRLDGVSVHLLRFGPAGIADEREVEAIRDSYHLRGWKHLVTTRRMAASSQRNHRCLVCAGRHKCSRRRGAGRDSEEPHPGDGGRQSEPD